MDFNLASSEERGERRWIDEVCVDIDIAVYFSPSFLDILRRSRKHFPIQHIEVNLE
jgi:hypothetical protein